MRRDEVDGALHAPVGREAVLCDRARLPTVAVAAHRDVLRGAREGAAEQLDDDARRHHRRLRRAERLGQRAVRLQPQLCDGPLLAGLGQQQPAEQRQPHHRQLLGQRVRRLQRRVGQPLSIEKRLRLEHVAAAAVEAEEAARALHLPVVRLVVERHHLHPSCPQREGVVVARHQPRAVGIHPREAARVVQLPPPLRVEVARAGQLGVGGLRIHRDQLERLGLRE
mmetsp:Transcript_31624/g.69154  ORF Transcript_31624/g.69154 Transcript_31624/m.69154 type:complete len:224 (-) Transcript_31624:275-946(-)